MGVKLVMVTSLGIAAEIILIGLLVAVRLRNQSLDR